MSYTREQAEEVWNDYHNSKLSFIKFLNHKFGQQLEVGKWYKYTEYNSKVCYQGDGVGFGTWEGEWGRSWGINSGWKPMTNEEVHDFLKSECEKRYKIGDVVKSVYNQKHFELESNRILLGMTYLFYDDIAVLNLSTGEWAEVIKKDPIAEQIEKLEKELETLKNKYNERN